MLLFSQPREDCLHGEVDAFDASLSSLRKSHDCCFDKAEKDAVKLIEERGEVPSVEEGHDAERHVGGVWRAERRCQSWRRAMMRRRVDSARQGFQRLRARLFERRHAAGEEVPRDAF